MVFQCPKAHCHAPAAVQVLRRVSPHGPHADRGSRDGWFNKPIIFVGIDGGYDGYIYIYHHDFGCVWKWGIRPIYGYFNRTNWWWKYNNTLNLGLRKNTIFSKRPMFFPSKIWVPPKYQVLHLTSGSPVTLNFSNSGTVPNQRRSKSLGWYSQFHPIPTIVDGEGGEWSLFLKDDVPINTTLFASQFRRHLP